MKISIVLYDTSLEGVSGSAVIRYSKPNEETFATVKDLLEGFNEIELVINKTHMLEEKNVPDITKLIYFLLFRGKSVVLNLIHN